MKTSSKKPRQPYVAGQTLMFVHEGEALTFPTQGSPIPIVHEKNDIHIGDIHAIQWSVDSQEWIYGMGIEKDEGITYCWIQEHDIIII